MWEDVFEVWERLGESAHKLASDLSLSNATLFMSAWMEANYADTEAVLELRRQPMREE